MTPQHILPSGYRLISSKLGFSFVAGYNRDFSTAINKDKKEMAMHTLKEMEQVESEASAQSWEDFCTFKSSGVSEFGGSMTEERRKTFLCQKTTLYGTHLKKPLKERRMVTMYDSSGKRTLNSGLTTAFLPFVAYKP
uniref:Ovule protein n=1 Tax=Haemonchus contortus TaxID=6289 RepID=A0A7I4XSQ2_HAECO